jgi:phosphate starvation-inducible PhoH-like protein
MASQNKRERSSQRQGRSSRSDPVVFHDQRTPDRVEKLYVLTAKTDAQRSYLNSIKVNTLTFGLGPAGTGKTFVAAWIAADMFERGDYTKLIITRPAIEAGEELGFLPGELEDKIEPYFVPVRETLERRLGKGKVEYLIKNEEIIFVPLAYMRGRTFDDAVVLLDEAQNTTPKQAKMFLTRIGERSKVIVNGDLNQSDIPGRNGLEDAITRLEGMKTIGVTRFSREDVVRSGLAQMIVEAYEGPPNDNQPSLPGFITGKRHDLT